MSTINPQHHNPQLTVKKETQSTKQPKSEKQASTESPKPQDTDRYDDTFVDPTGGLYKGAIRNGQVWQLPPDALQRVDMQNTVLEESEINMSFKANGIDAQFTASLKKEAVAFSDLNRRIHDLLGFTCDAYQTSFKAFGEITASGAIEDGTFFNTSFSAFASAVSIEHQYTFNNNFASQYDKNPQLTVESNFASLKGLMQSVVIQQGAEGEVEYAFRK